MHIVKSFLPVMNIFYLRSEKNKLDQQHLAFDSSALTDFNLHVFFLAASADVGFAIWDRYSAGESSPPVGYVAHLMGALAGLTIGLLVLKNFEQKLHSQVMWWVALGVYSALTLFAILWNIFFY